MIAMGLYGQESAEEVMRRLVGSLRTMGSWSDDWQVPGAADLRVEQTAGFPTLDMQFNRDAISRYGLTIEEVTDTVAAALGGRESGLVFEGDRRFSIVVRLDNPTRDNLDAVGDLPVMLPEGGTGPRHSVPLRRVQT